jgi:zinc and cadmium transporter
MLLLLLSCATVMLASLVGVFFISSSTGRFFERNMGYLVSFSAGVFLIIAYGLSTETLEHAPSAAQGVLYIFLGALGIWTLFKCLPGLHDHPEKGREHSHPIDPRRVLISDAFHNVGDGILLAASFAVSPALGLAATASVFVHELLQETSEFFVLRAGGYTVGRALLWSFLVSCTVLVGALGGYFFLDVFESLEPILLGLSAGAFLVVVLNDLIPHSVRDAKSSSHYAAHVAWFVLGAVLMFLFATFLGHD